MSKSKVSMPAAEISSKWNKNFKAGVSDAVKGIDRVTESPMEKAAAAQEKMLSKLNEAVTSGRWAGALSKVTLAAWKEKTKKKMTERAAGGADAAMDKRRSFDTWLANTLNGILPEIASMPDLTLSDSKARMDRQFDYMSEQKYKGT